MSWAAEEPAVAAVFQKRKKRNTTAICLMLKAMKVLPKIIWQTAEQIFRKEIMAAVAAALSIIRPICLSRISSNPAMSSVTDP